MGDLVVLLAIWLAQNQGFYHFAGILSKILVIMWLNHEIRLINMQDALILKLIIVALAATFVAVILALVLSFNVVQKLMKHNTNLLSEVRKRDEQQASTKEAFYQTEHELHKAEEELRKAQDKINDMMRQANQADSAGTLLQQEINDVTHVADMTDEQLMS